VRRGEKDRVGVRVHTHQRTADVERGRDRDAAEVFDDLTASHGAEHLAAVAFGVGDQPRVLARAIRVPDHHFLAAEHLRRLFLRGGARRDLDAEFRRERPQHVLRVLIAAREIDRHATEKHEVDAAAASSRAARMLIS
jgi:hypothetical protein